MKVIFVHQTEPDSQREGGGLRNVQNLMNYFTRNGVNTTLLGVQFTEQTSTRPNLTFIPILKCLPAQYRWYKFFIKLMVKTPFLKIPDSAIIHTFRMDYMLPFVIFCPRNPKVITSAEPLRTAMLSWPKLFWLISRLYNIFESHCLKRVDRIITHPSIAKKYYEKKHPKLKDKIVTMSSVGVNLDEFKPMDKKKARERYGFNPEEKIVIFLGRIEKIKNLDFLTRSYALVKQQILGAKLILVGQGGDQKRLEKLVQSLNLKGVMFLGECPHDKVPEILNCADVLALCSITESGAIVLVEALACGIPVVSTAVGVAPSLGGNDMIVKIVARDEKLFAKAIIDVLNAGSEDVREECRKISEALAFDEVARKVIKVYQSIL